MIWPLNRPVHPDDAFLGILQDTIAKIASAIAVFEPVYLIATPFNWANARARIISKVTLSQIAALAPLLAKANPTRLMSFIMSSICS